MYGRKCIPNGVGGEVAVLRFGRRSRLQRGFARLLSVGVGEGLRNDNRGGEGVVRGWVGPGCDGGERRQGSNEDSGEL